jgi:hypothetical protein
VLSGTVWGAAPGQNRHVQSGAVLTLKSGRRPPGCRGARSAGYPPRRHHPRRMHSRSCRHAGERKCSRPDTMAGSPRPSGGGRRDTRRQ